MVMVPDQRRCEKEYWLGLSLEVGKNGEKMRRKDTQISGERRKRESRGLSSVLVCPLPFNCASSSK
jgi:hypothetical protein